MVERERDWLEDLKSIMAETNALERKRMIRAYELRHKKLDPITKRKLLSGIGGNGKPICESTWLRDPNCGCD